MSVVLTRNLSRRYGQRTGIEDVDLRITEGEVFGFLGPNGAGKTTTIRLLLGFMRPSSGSATIFGLDCWRDSPRIKRYIGYLPGDVRLYSWVTCRNALELFSKVRQVDLRPSGFELAERFRLEPDLPVRKMSRGTRQKLGIILALAHKPRVLVLDEPTSGLDPLMQDELAKCVRESAASGGTVFFSSHTLSEVESLCDRVAVVRGGRIVASETIDSLRRQARRDVELIYANPESAAAAKLPDFLHFERLDRSSLFCELSGPAGPLIAWASRQPIIDLNVRPPLLESLFRKYYNSGGN